jgi:hypothetical protein
MSNKSACALAAVVAALADWADFVCAVRKVEQARIISAANGMGQRSFMRFPF